LSNLLKATLLALHHCVKDCVTAWRHECYFPSARTDN